MSRELWAVELPKAFEHLDANQEFLYGLDHRTVNALLVVADSARTLLDFDAIWDRYYEAADRRYHRGLTYDELRQVIFGGDEE